MKLIAYRAEESIEAAKSLAKKLGRRPNREELDGRGVAIGYNSPFKRVIDLLKAAGLADPNPSNPLGLSEAEEQTFQRLYASGVSYEAMERTLGLCAREALHEAKRRGWQRGRGMLRIDPGKVLTRRCQNEACNQVTQGLGPCEWCGAKGLTEAA